MISINLIFTRNRIVTYRSAQSKVAANMATPIRAILIVSSSIKLLDHFGLSKGCQLNAF